MRIKISEATNRQLDYLMALTHGYTNLHWRVYDPEKGKELVMTSPRGLWSEFDNLDYTIDHALTGPLIDKHRLSTSPEVSKGWCAFVHERLFEDDGSDCWSTGPTRLIAACRCIVTKHFGAEAEVPEDLV